MELQVDSLLVKQLQRPGWELKTNAPRWVIVEAPDPGSARAFYSDYYPVLTQWAEQIWTFIGNAQTKDLLQVPSKGDPMTATVQYAELATIRLTPNLLRVIDDMLSSPEKSGGLVRLADERQVCMPKSNEPYLMGLQLNEAVELHRRDFWHPQDLEEFRKLSRQQLEPDNPNSTLIFTFRSFDPKRGWPSPIDSTFTNEYQLVSDGQGQLYHRSKHLGMEEFAIAS